MNLLVVAILALMLGVAARGAAQHNRNVSLNWVRSSAANGCTSAKSVAQRIESYFRSDQLLEGESFRFVSAASAHIVIEAHVTPYQDGWQVEISVSKDDLKLQGSDFVQRSRSCRELEIQAALVISQLLDAPEFAPQPQELEARSVAPAAIAYADQTTLSSLTPDSPARIMPQDTAPGELLSWRASAGGLLERGLFVGSGLGLQIGLALVPPHLFPIELRAALVNNDGPTQYPNDLVGVPPNASSKSIAARLSWLACPAEYEKGRVGIGACGGIAGNAVLTHLTGFRRDDSAWVSWLSIEVGLRPSFRVFQSTHVWLEAMAAFTLVSSGEFVATSLERGDDRLTFYRAPKQTARLALGLSYNLY